MNRPEAPTVIGIGSPVVDLIVQVPETFLPQAGGGKGGMELVDDRSLEDLVDELPAPPVFAPGGNTLFALARLGVSSRLLGMVGNDADGALLKNADAVCHVPALPVENVVDTTGAGDLWAAGFLHGWLNGCELKRCGANGAILGAAAVAQQGASLPPGTWPSIRGAMAA